MEGAFERRKKSRGSVGFVALKGVSIVPPLNSFEASLHHRAVTLGHRHRRTESQLVAVLRDVDVHGLWRKFDRTSLFAYAVGELGISESFAYAHIAVARKSALVPALGRAVEDLRLTVSAAARIVACLTEGNADDVIAFASSHTGRETERECARRNPKSAEGDRATETSEGRVRLTVTVSTATHEAIKRVQSLEAQRGKCGGMERALEAAAEEYLERRDPVRKAERAQARKPESEKAGSTFGPGEAELCARRPKQKYTRLPLTAAQRHAVHARDGGRCAHVGEAGKRCGADRFVDVHHVRPVSRGGGNEPSNLTTLCPFHHDLVHQTSFPIDGQVSWIRAPEVKYAG